MSLAAHWVLSMNMSELRSRWAIMNLPLMLTPHGDMIWFMTWADGVVPSQSMGFCDNAVANEGRMAFLPWPRPVRLSLRNLARAPQEVQTFMTLLLISPRVVVGFLTSTLFEGRTLIPSFHSRVHDQDYVTVGTIVQAFVTAVYVIPSLSTKRSSPPSRTST